MKFTEFLFYFLGFLTLGSSLMVVMSRNPVNSAMYMILAFIATAGLFVMLDAYFLAILQVLVYAGAVVVLFIFVIMLLNVDKTKSREFNKLAFASAALGLFLLIFGVGYLVASVPELAMLERPAVEAMPTAHSAFAFTTAAKSFGYGLFTRYMLPFQIAGFLLLLAMVGVIVVSKKYEQKNQERKEEL